MVLYHDYRTLLFKINSKLFKEVWRVKKVLHWIKLSSDITYLELIYSASHFLDFLGCLESDFVDILERVWKKNLRIIYMQCKLFHSPHISPHRPITISQKAQTTWKSEIYSSWEWLIRTSLFKEVKFMLIHSSYLSPFKEWKTNSIYSWKSEI